jgi:transcriptional regulator GlxA family with amidase domain
LEQTREVSLNPMGLLIGAVLGNMFQIMDLLPTANLSMLGLDDLFYRILAVMMNQQVAQAFANPTVERQSRYIRREIKVACDYIQAHLAEVISLTDLERVSGLSARNLQLGFQQQFQCSPMQWVRRERFTLSRRLLLAAIPGDTVTKIALNCGFTQLGSFSQGYSAIFGEFPSETLRRALQRG